MEVAKVIFTSFFILRKWRSLGLEKVLNYIMSKKTNRIDEKSTIDNYGKISESILYKFPFNKMIKPTCLKLAIIQFYLLRNYRGEITFTMGFSRYELDGKKKLGGHAWILVDGEKWPNNFDDSSYQISYQFINNNIENTHYCKKNFGLDKEKIL